MCWSCVFWWVFTNVFALFFGVSLPKLFGKILLKSGLVFSGFVLSSLGFSPTSSSFSVFVFFNRYRSEVVTGHPFTRACLSGFFLFWVPPLLSVPPVLAVRPASWRFSGVPFWAPGVFGILAFCVPPHRPFFTRTFGFSPPQVFFCFFFLAFEASVRTGELVLRLRDECRDQAKLG